MKKNILTLLSSLLLVCTLFFAACGSDNKCTNECGTHGTLVQTDCSCNCAAGYKLDSGNGRCDVKILGYDMIGDYKSTSVKCIVSPSTAEVIFDNYSTNVSEVPGDAAGTKIRFKRLADIKCYTPTTGTVEQDYYVEGTMKGDSVIINTKSCATDFVGKGFFSRDATTKKVNKLTINYTTTADVKVGTVTTKVVSKCAEIFGKN